MFPPENLVGLKPDLQMIESRQRVSSRLLRDETLSSSRF